LQLPDPTVTAVQVSIWKVVGSQAVAPTVAQPKPTPTVTDVAGQAQAAKPLEPWQVSGDVQGTAVPAIRQPFPSAAHWVRPPVAQKGPATAQVLLQAQAAAPAVTAHSWSAAQEVVSAECRQPSDPVLQVATALVVASQIVWPLVVQPGSFWQVAPVLPPLLPELEAPPVLPTPPLVDPPVDPAEVPDELAPLLEPPVVDLAPVLDPPVLVRVPVEAPLLEPPLELPPLLPLLLPDDEPLEAPPLPPALAPVVPEEAEVAVLLRQAVPSIQIADATNARPSFIG
jgi:hypothetical protein